MSQEFCYLSSAETSKLFDLVLQLATDQHVANHRARALETLLVRRGVLSQGDVDGFTPTPVEEGGFDTARTEFMDRLVRIITENGPAQHPLRNQWEAAVSLEGNA